MFDLKDYEKYIVKEVDDVNPLRIASFNLNQWSKYERNIESLKDIEKEGAKRLFKALKHLTPEERSFLAEKYRMRHKGTNQKVPDKVLAKKHNLSIGAYAKYRKAIEYKFFHFLKDDLDYID